MRMRYREIKYSVKAGNERLKLLKDVKEGLESKIYTDLEYVQHAMSCLRRRGYMTAHHYNSILRIYNDMKLDEYV